MDLHFKIEELNVKNFSMVSLFSVAKVEVDTVHPSNITKTICKKNHGPGTDQVSFNLFYCIIYLVSHRPRTVLKKRKRHPRKC
jgi:hypothetical protein